MKEVDKQITIPKIKLSNFSPLFFQSPGFENNNTLLHLLVLTCCKTIYDFNSRTDAIRAIEHIDRLIEDVGLEAANTMALAVNDQGKTPMHILLDEIDNPANERLTNEKFDAIFTKLLRLMKRKEYTPLTDLISHQAVLDNASQTRMLSKQLQLNLLLGTYLTNLTRSVIKDSYTHPQINDYSYNKQEEIRRQIDSLRNEMRTYSESESTYDQIDFRHALIKNHQLGNCMEYAIFAYAEMRRLKFGIRAEIMYVKNGDHVFLVLDRRRHSELTNPATWGNNAIACDPWSGEVYPAENLLHHFGTLTSFITHKDKKRSNFVSSFNLRFHQIRCESELTEMHINRKKRDKINKACSEGGFIHDLATSRDRSMENDGATKKVDIKPS